MFIILSLPLVTVGFAAVVCLNMARFNTEERKMKLKEVIGIYVKPVFLKSFIMGLIDIIFLLLTVLCIVVLFDKRSSESMKIVDVLFLIMNMLFMLSIIYRYPILVYNESFSLKEILARGILITVSNLFKCILFALVIMTILIFSVLTGVGILFIFPGAVAFLMINIYKQTLNFEANKQN